MKTAIKLSILAALAMGFVGVACGDDEDTTTATPSATSTTTVGPGGSGGSGGSVGGSGGGGIPDVPTLGTQIDRKGRPAINTALNKTFVEPDPATDNFVAISDTDRGVAEDAWNAANDPSAWATTFNTDVATQLAVLDALNAGLDVANLDGCGDQAAYDPANPGYGTLATVLSNDWLIVKGDAAGGCNVYLGVEANFLGITNDDCGGRTPVYDVIDVSYSLLSGAFTAAPSFDFGDNVDVSTATEDAFSMGFPYLAAPN